MNANPNRFTEEGLELTRLDPREAVPELIRRHKQKRRERVEQLNENLRAWHAARRARDFDMARHLQALIVADRRQIASFDTILEHLKGFDHAETV